MVVRYLNDPNNQVRKTSQAALLVLLEQELIGKEDIEEQVVNVILDLASPDSLDDYRTEAVALMSKLAPLLGKDMTERLFLPRFCEMCTDPLFHVRKVCAGNFGDMCTVVGQDNTEQHLLPKFYYLCEDGVWGVRKACAECFMAVSCACSPDVRRKDLSKLFVNLLCDLSRWVRMAAFQQLGPFISTFADPGQTGLYVSDDGILCVNNPELLANMENLERLRNLECMVGQSINQQTLELCPDSDDPGDDEPSLPFTNKNSTENKHDNNNSPADKTESMDLSDIENPSDRLVAINSNVADASEDEDVSIEEKRVKVYLDKQEEKLDESGEKEGLSDVEGCCGSDSTKIVLKDATVGESSDTDNVPREENTSVSDVSECDIESQNEESCDKNIDTQANQPEEESSGESVHLESEKDTTDLSSATPSNLDGEISEKVQDTSKLCEEIAEMKLDNNTDDQTGAHIHSENVEDFNSFWYWRTPLPEIGLDAIEDIENDYSDKHTGLSNSNESAVSGLNSGCTMGESLENKLNADSGLDLEELQLELGDNSMSGGGKNSSSESDKFFTASVSTVAEEGETVDNIGSTHVIGQNLNETTMTVIDGIVQDSTFDLGYIDSNLLLSLLPLADINGGSFGYIDSDSLQDGVDHVDEATLAQQQDIVPQSLLESYLGMVDPSRAQTVDTEITRHCAYNLPAVAYTLGRQNWHCIKLLYETLAADMQWKVRRTLAFSIHEMAIILGEEITHRDLVPVFDGFLKDLDEVRIGVLRHLSDFLRLLKPEVRRLYLTKVQGFMNTDNQRNWRFRLELGEQLILISELYSVQEISQYLLPLGLSLAEDRVSEVRNIANRLISVIVRRFSDEKDEVCTKALFDEMITNFAQKKKWTNRQIFVHLCQAILEEDAISMEKFCEYLLPSLLSLQQDPIPNVRIALAKTVTRFMLARDYFSSSEIPYHEGLLKTVDLLQNDSDRDVRYFASPQPEITTFVEEEDEDGDHENNLDMDEDTLPV